MALPVNINELINGKIIEWERIEFKKAWNPIQVLHTICAFANDFNNWGGGYIIIGIEANEGFPVLPPVGVPIEKIDNIQKELLNLCHHLRPHYFPIVAPVDYQDKKIIIIWSPGGSNRPYEAPQDLVPHSPYHPFLRRYSATVKAKTEERNELLSMANQVPFDDQINHQANLEHLDRTLIFSFLDKVRSDLTREFTEIPLVDLARKLNIAEGPDEYLKPKNVGLLFFHPRPETFISGSRIEIVTFQNQVGDHFNEKILNGPIHSQISKALSFLDANIIVEYVQKVRGHSEALRYYSYPLEALEEAIVNAVYHKDYRQYDPVEIRILPDHIEILSYPGPLPPLSREALMKPNVTARRYRNRRIGDFLKELHLTEGRGTGLPKIRKSLELNGSPPPIFETDEDRNFFSVKMFPHPFTDMETTIYRLTTQSRKILKFCTESKTRQEIFKFLGMSSQTKNYKSHILPLIESGYLSLTIPDRSKDPKQKYRLTLSGQFILDQIEEYY